MSDSLSSADRDARIAAAERNSYRNGFGEMVVNADDYTWLIAELRAALSREEEAKKDAERLDAIERGLFRISPDGMDGWRVRAAGTLGGMRQGYVNYGAHRLREAIDSARSVSLSENG